MNQQNKKTSILDLEKCIPFNNNYQSSKKFSYFFNKTSTEEVNQNCQQLRGGGCGGSNQKGKPLEFLNFKIHFKKYSRFLEVLGKNSDFLTHIDSIMNYFQWFQYQGEVLYFISQNVSFLNEIYPLVWNLINLVVVKLLQQIVLNFLRYKFLDNINELIKLIFQLQLKDKIHCIEKKHRDQVLNVIKDIEFGNDKQWQEGLKFQRDLIIVFLQYCRTSNSDAINLDSMLYANFIKELFSPTSNLDQIEKSLKSAKQLYDFEQLKGILLLKNLLIFHFFNFTKWQIIQLVKNSNNVQISQQILTFLKEITNNHILTSINWVTHYFWIQIIFELIQYQQKVNKNTLFEKITKENQIRAWDYLIKKSKFIQTYQILGKDELDEGLWQGKVDLIEGILNKDTIDKAKFQEFKNLEKCQGNLIQWMNNEFNFWEHYRKIQYNKNKIQPRFCYFKPQESIEKIKHGKKEFKKIQEKLSQLREEYSNNSIDSKQQFQFICGTNEIWKNTAQILIGLNEIIQTLTQYQVFFGFFYPKAQLFTQCKELEKNLQFQQKIISNLISNIVEHMVELQIWSCELKVKAIFLDKKINMSSLQQLISEQKHKSSTNLKSLCKQVCESIKDTAKYFMNHIYSENEFDIKFRMERSELLQKIKQIDQECIVYEYLKQVQNKQEVSDNNYYSSIKQSYFYRKSLKFIIQLSRLQYKKQVELLNAIGQSSNQQIINLLDQSFQNLQDNLNSFYMSIPNYDLIDWKLLNQEKQMVDFQFQFQEAIQFFKNPENIMKRLTENIVEPIQNIEMKEQIFCQPLSYQTIDLQNFNQTQMEFKLDYLENLKERQLSAFSEVRQASVYILFIKQRLDYDEEIRIFLYKQIFYFLIYELKSNRNNYFSDIKYDEIKKYFYQSDEQLLKGQFQIFLNSEVQKLKNSNLNNQLKKQIIEGYQRNIQEILDKNTNIDFENELEKIKQDLLVRQPSQDLHYQTKEKCLYKQLFENRKKIVFEKFDHIKQNKVYVPLQMRKLYSDSNHRYNIAEIFEEFLQANDQNLMLIQGSQGAGKTLTIENIEYESWLNQQIYNYYPVSIYLPHLHLENHQQNFLEQALKQEKYQFSDKSITEFIEETNKDDKQKILIILDGYDELIIKGLKKQIISISNILSQLNLSKQTQYKIKFILTIQPNNLEHVFYYDWFQSQYNNHKSILELELLEFDRSQQEQFLDQAIILKVHEITQNYVNIFKQDSDQMNSKINWEKIKKFVKKYTSTQYEVLFINFSADQFLKKHFPDLKEQEKLREELKKLWNKSKFINAIENSEVKRLLTTPLFLSFVVEIFPKIETQYLYQFKEKFKQNLMIMANAEQSQYQKLVNEEFFSIDLLFCSVNEINLKLQNLIQNQVLQIDTELVAIAIKQNQFSKFGLFEQYIKLTNCSQITQAIQEQALKINEQLNYRNAYTDKNLMMIRKEDQNYSQQIVKLDSLSQNIQTLIKCFSLKHKKFICPEHQHDFFFFHKFMIDFFISKYIFELLQKLENIFNAKGREYKNEIKSILKHSSLNHEQLNLSKNDSQCIVSLLNDQLKNINFIDDLLIQIVQLSEDKEYVSAASNAIFLLGKRDTYLGNKSFQNIKLQDTILNNLSFFSSDLSNSEFINVSIDGCNFNCCILNEINWKNMTFRERATLKGQGKTVVFLQISPYLGNFIISVDQLGDAILQDYSTQTIITKFNVEKDRITQILFADNNNIILTSNTIGVIQIWKLKEIIQIWKLKKIIQQDLKPTNCMFQLNQNSIINMALSKDEKILYSINDIGQYAVWDIDKLKNGFIQQTFKNYYFKFLLEDFSLFNYNHEDQQLVHIKTNIQVEPKKEKQTVKIYAKKIAISSKRQLAMVLQNQERTILIQKLSQLFHNGLDDSFTIQCQKIVTDLCFSNLSNQIAVGSEKDIRIFDLDIQSIEYTKQKQKHQKEFDEIVQIILAENFYIVQKNIQMHCQTFFFIQLETHQIIHSIQSPSIVINCQLSNNEKKFVIYTQYGDIIQWNLDQMTIIYQQKITFCSQIVFSDDLKFFASFHENELLIQSLDYNYNKNSVPKDQYRQQQNVNLKCYISKFSPSCKFFVVLSDRQAIFISKTEQNEVTKIQRYDIQGEIIDFSFLHNNDNDVAFSLKKNSKYLLEFRKIDQNQLLGYIDLKLPIQNIHFLKSDVNFMVTIQEENIIQIWNIKKLAQIQLIKVYSLEKKNNCFQINDQWCCWKIEQTVYFQKWFKRNFEIFKPSISGIKSICFSPNDKFIVARNQLKFSIFNIQNKQEEILDGYQIAFRPGERILAIEKINGTIQLYDYQVQQSQDQYERGSENKHENLSFSPNGKILISTYKNELWIYNISISSKSNDEYQISKKGKFSHISNIMFAQMLLNNNEALVVDENQYHYVQLDPYIIKNYYSQISSLEMKKICSAAIHPIKKHIILCSQNQITKFAIFQNNSFQKQEIYQLEGQEEKRLNNILLIGEDEIAFTEEQEIKIAYFGQNILKISLIGKTKKKIKHLVFLEQKKLLASLCHQDNIVQFWDCKLKRLMFVIQESKQFIKRISFTRDGKYMASINETFFIKIQEVRQNCLKSDGIKESTINQIIYSSDNELLVVCGISYLKIFNLISYKSIFAEEGKNYNVKVSTFEQQKKYLICGGVSLNNGIIEIFNIQNIFAVKKIQKICYNELVPLSINCYNQLQIVFSNNNQTIFFQNYDIDSQNAFSKKKIKLLIFIPNKNQIAYLQHNANSIIISDYQFTEIQSLDDHQQEIEYFNFTKNGCRFISIDSQLTIIWLYYQIETEWKKHLVFQTLSKLNYPLSFTMNDEKLVYINNKSNTISTFCLNTKILKEIQLKVQIKKNSIPILKQNSFIFYQSNSNHIIIQFSDETFQKIQIRQFGPYQLTMDEKMVIFTIGESIQIQDVENLPQLSKQSIINDTPSPNPFIQLVISDKSKYLSALKNNNQIVIWDIQDKNYPKKVYYFYLNIEIFKTSISGFPQVYKEDTQEIIYYYNDQLYKYNVDNFKLICQYTQKEGLKPFIVFNENSLEGKIVIITDNSNCIIQSLNNSNQRQIINLQNTKIETLKTYALSPDFQTMVFYYKSNPNYITLYNLKNPEIITQKEFSSVTQLFFSSDSQLLISGGYSKICVFNVQKQELVSSYNKFQGIFVTMALNDKFCSIAAGFNNNSIELYCIKLQNSSQSQSVNTSAKLHDYEIMNIFTISEQKYLTAYDTTSFNNENQSQQELVSLFTYMMTQKKSDNQGSQNLSQPVNQTKVEQNGLSFNSY